MYKPIIRIDTFNSSFYYYCQNKQSCFKECKYKNKCEVLSSEFNDFYEEHNQCEYCFLTLNKFFVYLLYQIRAYLPKGFNFHCCHCNYNFGYDIFKSITSTKRISTNRDCRDCEYYGIHHTKSDPNFCRTFIQIDYITIDNIKQKLNEKHNESESNKVY